MPPPGHLLLLLHAHLPYVRHPEEPVFLEEDWLFEAIGECYLPLLHRLERLVEARVPTRLTMTWSPTLCEMLADPLLQERWRTRTARLLELAEQEVPAKAASPYAAAAVMYRDHLRWCLEQMARWHGNLLGWVCALRDAGVLEPITCGATHGFLPLMLTDEARRAQIAVAVANHRKHFGAAPRGIWLPECGYTPGVERLLAEHGIRYTFLDSHGLYFAEPRPRLGCFHHAWVEGGVAVFARDAESSRSVWSAQSGYPGDALYREFYRDLGHDGDYAYIRPFLHPDGVRRHLGLKYHRVTGAVGLHEKLPYEPAPAFRRAMDHAAHFVDARVRQAGEVAAVIGRPPVIVAPYDAELFGHWWFEGPQFIESIFHAAQGRLGVVTGSDWLNANPVAQEVRPIESSWGDNGWHGMWLNPANDWIYRHLHAAEERMVASARRFPDAHGDQRRALDQMARELLLAQASDWAFILTNATASAYATRRVRDHIHRFTSLYEQVIGGCVTAQTVDGIAWHDPIFPEIDYRVYA